MANNTSKWTSLGIYLREIKMNSRKNRMLIAVNLRTAPRSHRHNNVRQTDRRQRDGWTERQAGSMDVHETFDKDERTAAVVDVM